MPVITFHCPHCAADLKIRDDQITGAPVACPDCHKPIVIARDEFGHVTATAPATTASAKEGKNRKASTTDKAGDSAPGKTQTRPIVREELPQPDPPEPRRSKWKNLSRTAVLSIAGSVVALAVIVVAGILFWPRGARSEADTTDATASPSVAAATGAGKKSLPAATASLSDAAKTGPTPPTVAGRFTGLGQRIAEYRATKGHFPTGASGQVDLAAGERLSWLADLVATNLAPGGPAPYWSESWRSQPNERFVRQRIPEFLNPAIDRLTGPENYPTTHFAGVAGVGKDAADLPIGHPRAGIFGNNRATRMEDIRDGASNTLMVVGVSGNLGSWAAPGTATVRALTQEPYVNGPDGIGTGSPDRMMVLKADGSVQEFSAKTDPRILRRMAAMADGLPLDPKVPGEPGEESPRPAVPDLSSSAAKESHPSPTKTANGAAKPSTEVVSRPALAASRPASKKVVNAPPPPKVDVATALGQRVVRFQQAKPVPLRDILNWLEELATVPIRGDRQEIADLDDLLQTPVSLDLENTTVARILEAVLAPARLTYQVQAGAIQLHRVGGSGSASQ